MKYIWPATGEAQDTATMPLAVLTGLLKALMHNGHLSKWFVETNGPGSLAAVCRGVRARLFREGAAPRGLLRSLLNNLDPPRCRCGAPGTHISGGTTFCATCGRTPQQQRGAARMNRTLDGGRREQEGERKARDYRDLNTTARRRGKHKGQSVVGYGSKR